MTKEELVAKLNQINSTVSQKERVELLEEVHIALRGANAELQKVYTETRAGLDAEKIKKAQTALQ